MAEELRRRPGDQPLPVPNDGPSMHDLVADDIRRECAGHPAAGAVVSDLLARRQLGLERYGSLLQAHKGRDGMRDLYEEVLDATVYARQEIAEMQAASRDAAFLVSILRNLIADAIQIRELLAEVGPS